ncbi:putative acyltransferase [Sphingomonas sp. F9_3S_D5_B_2]
MPAPTEQTRPERLVSLDLLRGLAVIGMILVNEMAGMAPPVYPLLLHSHWDGLTIADVVFPSFLFMVGVSIPLSLRRVQDADYARIFWRTVRLVLLGFILSNIFWFSQFNSGNWRLFGVLQRIGLVYGACAVMVLNLSPRTRLIIAAAILVLYWPMSLIPTLDGVSTDIWVRGHNLVGSVDRVLLGAGNHIYVPGPEGYDPEGLLGTLPALAQGLIGVAVGEYLIRDERGERTRSLAIAGAAMVVAGIAWGFVFPVIKDIWSSTFVLVTTGIALLLLSALHAAFDGKPMTGIRRAMEVVVLPFGMNAIAAYTLHEVAYSLLGWDLIQLPYRQLKPVLGGELAAFVPVLLFIAFVWLAMFYLWRKRWLIRI